LTYCHYVAVHPHLQIRRENDKTLIPDFFLEDRNGMADIFELKLPGTRVVVGKGNRRCWSHEVHKALAQLRDYQEYFEDVLSRDIFFKQYGLTVYKPSATLIIGRSMEFQDALERRKLLSRYSNCSIITYDDLMDVAKQRSLWIGKSLHRGRVRSSN
jgi:hypothetical protein